MRSRFCEHRQFGKAEAGRALDRLWEIFHHRGHGTIAKVERELGLSPRTLNHWRHRGQLRYADLLAVLSVLGVDPGLFLGSLFPASVEIVSAHPQGGLGLLLQRWETLLYRDAVASLEVLAPYRVYRTDYRYCLAVGRSLKTLEMWGEAKKWLDQAVKLAPTEEERAACALRVVPILALPMAQPEKAQDLVDQLFPLVPVELRSLATLYKAIIFRATGEWAGAAKCSTVAMLDAAASPHTQIAARQILGMVLAQSGDVKGGLCCLSEALVRCTDRWSRGHVLWAIARFSEGEQAARNYAAALRSFGKFWIFESLMMTAERFERLGHDDEMYALLTVSCKEREGVFLAVAEEMKAASELPWRQAPDLSRVRRSWDRWKKSQLRKMRLSL